MFRRAKFYYTIYLQTELTITVRVFPDFLLENGPPFNLLTKALLKLSYNTDCY